MNILFVNQYIDEVGGVEHYLNTLSERLIAEGHNIYFIYGDKLIESSFRKYTKTFNLPDIWNNPLCLKKEIKLTLRRTINDIKPDVIYLHNIENLKVVDIFSQQVPTVRYVHGCKSTCPDGKRLLHNPMETCFHPASPLCTLRAHTRRCMPRHPVKSFRAYAGTRRSLKSFEKLKRILVASKYMKNILEINGVLPHKIEILPYFAESLSSNISSKYNGSRRILFAGRIANGKGLEYLFYVLKLLKEKIFLDVVGDGPLRKECQEKINKLGLKEKVRFHGWVHSEKMADFYKKASFLVIPSIWPEPFGIVGIEAALYGRPAVAFDVGGISDWLKHGKTGFLINPYDKVEMARKIDLLLKDSKMAEEMGKNANKLVGENFSPKIHIHKLLNLFEKL
ncbi:glycosyltransferase family 4 protein [bacterium]|nr:glycosyltransferase family 4 protein [bacterium]